MLVVLGLNLLKVLPHPGGMHCSLQRLSTTVLCSLNFLPTHEEQLSKWIDDGSIKMYHYAYWLFIPVSNSVFDFICVAFGSQMGILQVNSTMAKIPQFQWGLSLTPCNKINVTTNDRLERSDDEICALRRSDNVNKIVPEERDRCGIMMF